MHNKGDDNILSNSKTNLLYPPFYSVSSVLNLFAEPAENPSGPELHRKRVPTIVPDLLPEPLGHISASVSIVLGIPHPWRWV